MEMSPQEKQRFDRLSKDDQLKLKAVMQMMQKEKDTVKEENVTEANIEEMTRDAFERMDGLVDQSLLIKFLDTFEEIYGDYVEGGDPFDTSDVINFLSIMMQNRAEDARLDSRSFEEGVNEEKSITITKDQMDKLHKGEPVKLANKSFLYKVDSPKKENTTPGPKNPDGTPKSDAEMTDDEREDYYLNLDTMDEGVEFFKRIAFKK
jgi:hypothetical protein